MARRTPRPIKRGQVGRKVPKKRVLVVTEGKNTEPQYLSLLQPCCRAGLIELEIVDEPSTDPKSLVDRACSLKDDARRRARGSRDPNEDLDEVWCVYDVDDHPFHKEAQDRARAKGVNLAISNPSFELWLLLHFQNQTAYISRDRVLEALRNHISGYDKRITSIELLDGKYALAKGRAQALESKHLGDATLFPQNNPSSDVWKLVDSISGSY